MNWQQRLQDAQRYVDQTYASYNQAQQQSQQAMNDYNQSFTNKPDYQTIYDQYKKQYTESEDILKGKGTYEKARDAVNSIKTRINNLSTSVNQQFGGTALTQEQRDKYKDQQYNQLNQMFTQYNADYQAKFEDYQSKVNKAFSKALDNTNKQYDSYWDATRRKFNAWKQSLDNANKRKELASNAAKQNSDLQSEYRSWQIEQETMRQIREIEERYNRLAARLRQQTLRRQQNSQQRLRQQLGAIESNYRAKADRTAAAKAAWASDSALLRSGRMSSAQFWANADSGKYAYD